MHLRTGQQKQYNRSFEKHVGDMLDGSYVRPAECPQHKARSNHRCGACLDISAHRAAEAFMAARKVHVKG